MDGWVYPRASDLNGSPMFGARSCLGDLEGRCKEDELVQCEGGACGFKALRMSLQHELWVLNSGFSYEGKT